MKNKIYYMCLTAIFISLTLVVTLYLNVPMGVGNVNLGDSIILLSAIFLPTYLVGLVSLGAVFADIIGGYASFAIFTLIIKFIEAIIVSLLLRYLRNLIVNKNIRFLIASFFGIVIMPIGYFFTNWILFDLGSAIFAIGHDFIQALISFLIANILFIPLSRIFKGVNFYA